MALAARRARRYCLYVSGTQDKADDHVGTIAALLEDRSFGRDYSALSQRHVGKFGSSRGWRHNRLWTDDGFIVDAAGLDKDIRGLKHEERRPDLIVIDDVDGSSDSAEVTAKRIERLKRDILPAGSPDVVVLVVQNVIRPDGLVGRMVAGESDYLVGATLSGPVPAIAGLAYEQVAGRYVITAGTATWAGQSLEVCQAMVDLMGMSAFLRECQHEVESYEGSLYANVTFQRVPLDDVPPIVRYSAVWVDPAVTETDGSDACGMQLDGLGEDGRIYRFVSWEKREGPLEAIKRAIVLAMDYGTDVGIETDQGGDTWQSVYIRACNDLGLRVNPERGEVNDIQGARVPRLKTAKAGAVGKSKVERGQQMVADYERGRVVHVLGHHEILERALRRFPVAKPYDLHDAAYWSWRELAVPAGRAGVASREWATSQRGYMKDMRGAR